MSSLGRFAVLTITICLGTFAGGALADSCTSLLPPSDAVSGWKTIANSTMSGEMGGKKSYDAYDGAVDVMKEKGQTYFAQRMYKQSKTGRYVTVDVCEMEDAEAAQKLYVEKQEGFKRAKPLNNYTSIRDRAFVGTMKTFTYGACQRGKYVFEVSMSKASTSQSRATAKSFLIYISKKLDQ